MGHVACVRELNATAAEPSHLPGVFACEVALGILEAQGAEQIVPLVSSTAPVASVAVMQDVRPHG